MSLTERRFRIARYVGLARASGWHVCAAPTLFHCFRALHGPPSGSSFFWLVDCPYFELFEPHRRKLQPFRASSPGTIHSDEARHVNAEVVRLDRPHALGDPFLPAVNSVEVCSLLMLYGGAASSWAAQYILSAGLRSPDVKRDGRGPTMPSVE